MFDIHVRIEMRTLCSTVVAKFTFIRFIPEVFSSVISHMRTIRGVVLAKNAHEFEFDTESCWYFTMITMIDHSSHLVFFIKWLLHVVISLNKSRQHLRVSRNAVCDRGVVAPAPLTKEIAAGIRCCHQRVSDCQMTRNFFFLS